MLGLFRSKSSKSGITIGRESQALQREMAMISALGTYLELLVSAHTRSGRALARCMTASDALWGTMNVIVRVLPKDGVQLHTGALPIVVDYLGSLERDRHRRALAHHAEITSQTLDPLKSYADMHVGHVEKSVTAYRTARREWEDSAQHLRALQRSKLTLPKRVREAQAREERKQIESQHYRLRMLMDTRDTTSEKDMLLLEHFDQYLWLLRRHVAQRWAHCARARTLLEALGKYTAQARRNYLVRAALRAHQIAQVEHVRSHLRHTRLVDLMMHREMGLLTALACAGDIGEKKEIITLFVKTYDGLGELSGMLAQAVQLEVDGTGQASTLFRANTVTTKLMSATAMFVGAGYLKATLGPMLQLMIDSEEHFEVRPDHIQEGNGDPETNLHNLQRMAERFVRHIMGALDTMPMLMRFMARCLWDAVRDKFPEVKINVPVGGFIMLRFFCPALFSPFEFGLVTEAVDERVQQGLILITKVLQTLSNNIHFSVKNAALHTLSPWLDDMVPLIFDYFERIIAHVDLQYEPHTSLAEVHSVVLPQIAKLVRSHLSQLETALSNYNFFGYMPAIMYALAQVDAESKLGPTEHFALYKIPEDAAETDVDTAAVQDAQSSGSSLDTEDDNPSSLAGPSGSSAGAPTPAHAEPHAPAAHHLPIIPARGATSMAMGLIAGQVAAAAAAGTIGKTLGDPKAEMPADKSGSPTHTPSE